MPMTEILNHGRTSLCCLEQFESPLNRKIAQFLQLPDRLSPRLVSLLLLSPSPQFVPTALAMHRLKIPQNAVEGEAGQAGLPPRHRKRTPEVYMVAVVPQTAVLSRVPRRNAYGPP